MPVTSIFPFSHNVSYSHQKSNSLIWATYNLSSANAFNLDRSTPLPFGGGLIIWQGVKEEDNLFLPFFYMWMHFLDLYYVCYKLLRCLYHHATDVWRDSWRANVTSRLGSEFNKEFTKNSQEHRPVYQKLCCFRMLLKLGGKKWRSRPRNFFTLS